MGLLSELLLWKEEFAIERRGGMVGAVDRESVDEGPIVLAIGIGGASGVIDDGEADYLCWGDVGNLGDLLGSLLVL